MDTRKIILFVIYFGVIIVLTNAIVSSYKSTNTSNVSNQSASNHSVATKAQSSSKSSKPNTQPSSASSNPPTTAPSNKALTNTGPGDVIAIFIVVSLAAAFTHWRYTAYKLY